MIHQLIMLLKFFLMLHIGINEDEKQKKEKINFFTLGLPLKEYCL